MVFLLLHPLEPSNVGALPRSRNAGLSSALLTSKDLTSTAFATISASQRAAQTGLTHRDPCADAKESSVKAKSAGTARDQILKMTVLARHARTKNAGTERQGIALTARVPCAVQKEMLSAGMEARGPVSANVLSAVACAGTAKNLMN